jgi:hypothetical protein
MNSLNFFNINKKFIFLLMTAFYSAVNAQCIAYTGQPILVGNTYCLNGNLTVGTISVFQTKQHLLFSPDSCSLLSIQVNGVGNW